MGYLERNLLSTQDLSGITSGSLGITSGSRVPTILPTAIPDTTYLGSARSTTLQQPFALTIFGDTARATGSETSSTGTCSAIRIASGVVRALWNRFTTRVPFTLPWLRWISLHLLSDDKWRPQVCLPNHEQMGMELIQPMQMDVRLVLFPRTSCPCDIRHRSTLGLVRCILSISAIRPVPRYVCMPQRLRGHHQCYDQNGLLHLDTYHHYCVRWVPACPHFCQLLS